MWVRAYCAYLELRPLPSAENFIRKVITMDWDRLLSAESAVDAGVTGDHATSSACWRKPPLR
jgi:hypothetical protein